jgi:hypothetical protein
MWKAFWKKWTIEKPAILGDWLWDVFVVQLAAFLNRLTLRQIIACIPVIILILAYSHEIPISPALIFVGDLLAYIDVFAVLFLLGLLSRAATVWFIIKRAAARVGRLARRLDFRHRRERGTKGRRRLSGRSSNNDDEPVIAGAVAWA